MKPRCACAVEKSKEALVTLMQTDRCVDGWAAWGRGGKTLCVLHRGGPTDVGVGRSVSSSRSEDDVASRHSRRNVETGNSLAL